MRSLQKNSQGFTLVELLIVIAIIAILAAIAFVAIDPAQRINEAQNSERWSAVNAIADAFLQYTVDNGGTYPGSMSAGDIFMVHSGAVPTGASSEVCASLTTAGAFGVDLSTDLETAGYIGALPDDPDGVVGFDANATGYAVGVAANGILTVSSCSAELSETIEVLR